MSLLRNLAARMKGEVRRASRQGEAPPVPIPETHGENFVTSKVWSMDAKPETIRGGAGYIHGSSLIGLCPRRQCLTTLAGAAGVKVPRSADRLVWAIGRAVEAHIRTQFITAMDRVGVVGVWSCKCGKTKTEGIFVRRSKCEVCRGSLLKYGELSLLDHDARIAGNPDLMYLRPDTLKLRTVEIKSINKKEFDALTAPKADHVTQSMIYRRLAARNEMDVDNSTTIIYGCKDYSFRGSPYREFYVPVLPQHEAQLDRMWADAGAVKAFLKGMEEEGTATLPPRLALCTSALTTTAKGCDQCGACFAR